MAPTVKKTRGRQRVPLEPMKKKSNRLVTFSKRRTGLFKKLSELCILCGARASVVVFSPARKAFSFGHPSVPANVHRFLTGGSEHDFIASLQSDAQQYDLCLRRANGLLTRLKDRFESEKKATGKLDRARNTDWGEFWLVPLDDIQSPSRLDALLGSASELRDKLLDLIKTQNTLPDANFAPSLGSQNPGQLADQPPPQLPTGNEDRGSFGDQGRASFHMPTQRGPNDHRPMVMIPTPMASSRAPSMPPMESNGITMVSINPPQPTIPFDTMAGGFIVPNFPPYQGVYDPLAPYQGVNNPTEFGALLQLFPPSSFTMANAPPMVRPGTSQSFTSLLMGDSPDSPSAPFDSQSASDQAGPRFF